VVKCVPVCLQDVFYNKGNYNKATTLQTVKSLTEATGINPDFMNAYSVLENMTSMTSVTDESVNTFLMMSNDTAHEPAMLQEPEYTPSEKVDNSDYEDVNGDRLNAALVSEQTGTRVIPLNMYRDDQYMSYQSNMAALIKVGEWLTYLKDNGVYDNTRVIIVADHGANISQIPSMTFFEGEEPFETERYYPLLMVKDFADSKEDAGALAFSDEFMTNADVPTLATKDIISNPKNPFTGKLISNSDKYTKEQLVIDSNEWNVDKNNGKKFIKSTWLSVRGDVRDVGNWKVVKE